MTLIETQPRRICLMRHAQATAAAGGQRDFDRSLSDVGHDQAEIVADRAADKGYRPDLLISSTAVRCRQTAEILHRAFGQETELMFVDALYNGTLDTYLQLLTAQQDRQSVLLLAHNPAIEETLLALAGPGALQSAIPGGYPTAGFAALDRRASADRNGSLWTLTEFLTG
jgi:phosphohistidine phosphatase